MKFSKINELMIQYFIIDNNLLFSLTFMLSLTTVNCCSMESTPGSVREMGGGYLFKKFAVHL